MSDSRRPEDEPEVRLSWEHVLWSIDHNLYAKDYRIGDEIPLDLGAEGTVNMVVAGIKKDELAGLEDGDKRPAHMTFISKEALATPKARCINDGKRRAVAWADCELRSYLKNTIKPLIRQDISERILEVTKTYKYSDPDYYSVSAQHTQKASTVADDIWIPSYDEVSTSYQAYPIFREGKVSRQKWKVDDQSVYYDWWLRDVLAYKTSMGAYYIDTNGSYQTTFSETVESGVVIGFCL